MILGFDGRYANRERKAGVGRYSAELLRALPQADDRVKLRIYLDRPPLASLAHLEHLAEIRVLPEGRFWMQRILASELRQNPPDVFFSSLTQLPLRCRVPAIAAIHDLAFLRFPDQFTLQRRWQARLQTAHVVRCAAHLLTISEATRQDVIQRYHVPESRVTVAYAGCPSAFLEPAVSRGAASRIEGLPDRYFLYVGRIQPRKNLSRLIQAFEMLCARHPDFPQHLVIAGDTGWLYADIFKQAEASPVRSRIHFQGFVPDAALPALMANADALLLVSLWEGFGLPVAEAMALGTPVIASNCSSLPEVAGDAGLLVDPYDVDAIAGAMERIALDAVFCEACKRRGPEQARRFTWERTAGLLAEAAWRLHAT